MRVKKGKKKQQKLMAGMEERWMISWWKEDKGVKEKMKYKNLDDKKKLLFFLSIKPIGKLTVCDVSETNIDRIIWKTNRMLKNIQSWNLNSQYLKLKKMFHICCWFILIFPLIFLHFLYNWIKYLYTCEIEQNI